jgi:hypothetical protein
VADVNRNARPTNVGLVEIFTHTEVVPPGQWLLTHAQAFASAAVRPKPAYRVPLTVLMAKAA